MSTAAPIDSASRIGELDVLRGFALLGVFIVHFVGSTFHNLPLDEAIAVQWQAEPLHFAALFFTELFFYDKANTLFATLFGMGFWIMLDRLESSGRDVRRIYLRRLAALFLIGLVNLFLLFPGDVLHEYAVLGLVLFALRGIASRWMLGLGLLLALLGRPIGYHLLPDVGAADAAYDAALASAFAQGSYWSWMTLHAEAHVVKDLVNGLVLGWALYILGRFLVGAWVIRQGWIQRAAELRPRIRAWFPWVFLVGFLLEAGSTAIYMDVMPASVSMERLLHITGAPLLALGYAMGLILLFRSERGRGAAALLAPVGRIALTAYVGHGVVLTWMFQPFGFGLLGTLGPFACLLLALGTFAGFAVFARFWLGTFRYGPLEYLWRWATYGTRPAFRR